MKFIIIVAGLLASGCASSPPTTFYKDGATPESFAADKRQCDYESTVATQTTDAGMKSIFGQELDRAIRKNDIAMQCMRAKGYRT